MTSTEDDWIARERQGWETGHLVARCPACGDRQMIAYRPPSQVPPRCRICEAAPRLAVISDRSRVTHKRPGQPRSAKLLRAAGLIVPGA